MTSFWRMSECAFPNRTRLYFKPDFREERLTMGQTVLKENAELITLIYYCFNIGLTIVISLGGTFYLRHRDRKDHQRREWRHFAERIHTDYSKLKSKDIPQKISKVKNTFEAILIHSTVTGLDILRYMLTDDNYRNFASESPPQRPYVKTSTWFSCRLISALRCFSWEKCQ